MKNMTSAEVRALFLKYFKEQGHMIEPGASLVPHNDPTLLWINSGVAALKKYFDGSVKPANTRIANVQKSIRTNDIENVGKTARHHTFFEMLGNFSIGDYFKKEAIHFAWEFLTSTDYIGFDKDKMYVSVYVDDHEARDIWLHDIGLPESHLLMTEDNFWEIGEGPCGPNSELFYDRGEAYDPDGIGERLFFEELENDRYMEVWNVVFSQFDAKEGVERSAYRELPQKNIDTGMGFERLVSLIQEGETNFDTDLFLPIIHATEKFSTHSYSEKEYKMAYRVIADHIRTVTFALADGALFSNEGRGYVLRRVLRRAVRFGRKLDINGAFMYKLVPVVYDVMKSEYGYIGEKVEYIQKLVKSEEERFHATLQDGEVLLHRVMSESKDKMIDGSSAFQLYDTYGFPLELTLEIAEEEGYSVDKDGFEKEMKQQRERAKNAREDIESFASQSADLMNFTDESTFIGYDQLSCVATVIAVFEKGEIVSELTSAGEVIFDQTVFYAESGGQVGDCGTLDGSATGRIINTKKAPHKQHLHSVILDGGTIKVGDELTISVDAQKRARTTRNHSATHLLQSAIRSVVGDHIGQAGSFVNDEYFRFDFTHYEKLTSDDLKQIELLMNQYVEEGSSVTKTVMPIEEAKNSGAIALFDEKYGDEVRVVSMGLVSKEFCGGCHVNNTGEIGVVKIISEESIGSGTRRITGTSGLHAYEAFRENTDTLATIASELKMKGIKGVDDKVEQLMEQLSSTKKELSQLQSKMFSLEANSLVNEMSEIGEFKYILKEMNGADTNALKDIASQITNQVSGSVVFLSSSIDDKIMFVAGADQKAVDAGIKCGDLVKIAASLTDGKGGGRPNLAQSGGTKPENVCKIYEEIEKSIGIALNK